METSFSAAERGGSIARMGWTRRLSLGKWAITVLVRELRRFGKPFERDRWFRDWLEAAIEAKFERRVGKLVPSVTWEQFAWEMEDRTLIHCLHEPGPLIGDEFRGESFSLLFPRELFILAGVARLYAPLKLFEFGSARGGTAVNLLQNSPEGSVLFTIDREPMASPLPEVLLMMQQGRLVPIVGDSRTTSLESHYGTCDLVFVDGGHDEATVRSDTEKALSLVSKRGIVLWHDFHPRWPEVVSVILELANTRQLRRFRGTRLVYYSF